MMEKYENSWRGNTSIFQKQLDLNTRTKLAGSYPDHWKDILTFLGEIRMKLLDIGCRVWGLLQN